MANNRPVYEVAKALDMPSKALVEAINSAKLGFTVKSHSSRLTPDQEKGVLK